MEGPILGELIDIEALLARRADMKQRVRPEVSLDIQGVLDENSYAWIGDDEKESTKSR